MQLSMKFEFNNDIKDEMVLKPEIENYAASLYGMNFLFMKRALRKKFGVAVYDAYVVSLHSQLCMFVPVLDDFEAVNNHRPKSCISPLRIDSDGHPFFSVAFKSTMAFPVLYFSSLPEEFFENVEDNKVSC